MDANEDDDGRRKKLIVPIIVIFLCLFAVVGVAYAYSSAFHVNDNSLDSGSLTIDYKVNGEGERKAVFSDDSPDVIFSEIKVYDKSDWTSDTKYKFFGETDLRSELGMMTVTVASTDFTLGDLSMSITVADTEAPIGKTYVLSDIVESITVAAERSGSVLGSATLTISDMGTSAVKTIASVPLTESGEDVTFSLSLNLKNTEPRHLADGDTVPGLVHALESIKFSVTAYITGTS